MSLPKQSLPKVAWKGWVIATMVSGATGFVTTMTYVHGFIFPRTEGEKLEARVSKVEDHGREDYQALRADIKDVHEDVRHILDALLEDKK